MSVQRATRCGDVAYGDVNDERIDAPEGARGRVSLR